jgi:hypothetical protein
MRHFQLIRRDSIKSSQRSLAGHKSLHTTSVEAEPTPRDLEEEHLLCRGYSQGNVAAIFRSSVSAIPAHAASPYRKGRSHTRIGPLSACLERKGIFVAGEENDRHNLHGWIPLEVAQ